jgi:thymidylate kinase
VRAAFHQIHREEPERFHLLDASQPIDHVYRTAMTQIRRALA